MVPEEKARILRTEVMKLNLTKHFIMVNFDVPKRHERSQPGVDELLTRPEVFSSRKEINICDRHKT